MTFVIFEDLAKATGPKVHDSTCKYYQNWLRNHSTTTTRHGPCSSIREAVWICRQISSRVGKPPSAHDCVRAGLVALQR